MTSKKFDVTRAPRTRMAFWLGSEAPRIPLSKRHAATPSKARASLW